MGRKKTNSKRVNFYLPKRQIKKIKKLAKGKGITYSELIRRYLDRELEQKENK